MTKCNEDDIPGIDIRIHGPFNDLRPHEMERKLRHFMSATSLDDYEHYFRKGMYLAQDPQAFDEQRQDRLFLTEEEKKFLELDKEPTIEEPGAGSRWKLDLGKWNLPWALWRLVALCGLGAMVQGWDEAAVDGAQLSYLAPFGFSDGLITADYRVGLINSAPYLCCVLSCWFTQPLNAKLGRRGTIFVTAIISAAFALAQAFSPTGNWRILFGFRLLMGLGIGPKSATIPIYAAESAPANIRGSLVMMWQVFTAVGIMFGCLSGVVFQNTGPNNWRYMLASPMVAPIILAMYIFTQPESPRWTIAKGHEARDGENASRAKAYYQQAFDALVALRHTKVQASRDLFLIYYLLENEKEEVKAVRMDPNKSWYQKGVFELFTKRRNRRALTANLICMFAQQFCGVNVIVYYSNIFLKTLGGFSNIQILLFSAGFGIINFVFAIPAFYTIDTFGRRSLLLFTFPFLALFQLWIAIAFKYQHKPGSPPSTGGWNNAWILGIAGMYLFGVAYSPGEGPVPFVYAAESMPLYIRDVGMGLVTSVNWLFNWLVAFTFPWFFKKFDVYGAFLWYAGWCLFLWVLIFFLVPETRLLSLEQLDIVFKERSARFAKFALNRTRYNIRRHIQRDKTAKAPPPPYENIDMKDASTRWTSISESNIELADHPGHKQDQMSNVSHGQHDALRTLKQELAEGDITQKGYEKKKALILSQSAPRHSKHEDEIVNMK